MRLNKKDNSGFTMIMVVFLVGFMLMLTTGTYNLILRELYDNRGAWSYMNAFAGAEGAQELALLKIKEKGYGIDDDVNLSSDSRSKILAKTPLNPNPVRDAEISYKLNTRTNSYTGELPPLSYSIIPLFYINTGSVNNIVGVLNNISLTLNGTSILAGDLVWNIVGSGGISGTGIFDESSIGYKKTLNDVTSGANTLTEQSFSTGTINSFLGTGGENYLILLNSNTSSTGSFTLSSTRDFTRPETNIISSAKVGIYKQNLTTNIDNTEFLNILKYSIFSN